MKYTLVNEDNPILKKVCEEHIISEHTEDLVYNMIVVMKEHDGIGLAAPQVGVSERIFVIGHESTGFVVCINPILHELDDAEEESFTEGCLSYPNLGLKVKRKNKIACEFTNIEGVRKTSEFSGVWAQAIQHEMDHLDGITFDTKVGATTLSLANSKRRETAKRKARIAKRKSKES